VDVQAIPHSVKTWPPRHFFGEGVVGTAMAAEGIVVVAVAVAHSRAVIQADPVHNSGASHWQRLTCSFEHLGAFFAQVGVHVLPAVVHTRSPVQPCVGALAFLS
jgi:hypothetical protein